MTLLCLGLVPSLETSAEARSARIEVGVAINVDEVELSTGGDAQCQGVPEIPSLAADQRLAARMNGGRVLLLPRNGGGDLAVHELAETLRIIPRSDGALVSVNGKRYRGALKIFRSPAGKINVVNVVGVEDYLRGVLPHEIGQLSGQTLEAGKAQAVAARTYSLSYIGRRSEEGFDVYDTVMDQVYGGVKDEGAITDRCIRETAGIVVLSKDRLIRANYSSTCGGVTSNIEDVWPEPAIPWLRSVADHSDQGGADFCKISSQYRWTDVWEIQEFLDIINQTYPRVVRDMRRPARILEDVRVESRSPSGRVAELVIETDVGRLEAHGDNTRFVLLRPKRSRGVGGGGGILRSALFKIALLRDSSGQPYAVVASGAGYGHGVGMCQMGAIAMARGGYSFQEILRHYYTDVDVRRESYLAEGEEDTRGH